MKRVEWRSRPPSILQLISATGVASHAEAEALVGEMVVRVIVVAPLEVVGVPEAHPVNERRLILPKLAPDRLAPVGIMRRANGDAQRLADFFALLDKAGVNVGRTARGSRGGGGSSLARFRPRNLTQTAIADERGDIGLVAERINLSDHGEELVVVAVAGLRSWFESLDGQQRVRLSGLQRSRHSESAEYSSEASGATHRIDRVVAHEQGAFGAAFLVDSELGPNFAQVLDRIDVIVIVSSEVHIFATENEIEEVALSGVDLVWLAEASCASASGQINRLEDRQDVVRASSGKDNRLEIATSRVEALVRVF